MMTSSGSGLSLEVGLDLSGMDFRQLWTNQILVGGDLGELEIEAYVLGVLRPSPYAHDVIAQAINEHFIDRGGDHPVAYDPHDIDM